MATNNPNDKVTLKATNGAGEATMSISEIDRTISMLMELRAVLAAAYSNNDGGENERPQILN